MFSTDPQIRVTQAYALLAKGNRDAALAAFNDSLAQGANPSAFFGVARLHADAGRLPEARSAINDHQQPAGLRRGRCHGPQGRTFFSPLVRRNFSSKATNCFWLEEAPPRIKKRIEGRIRRIGVKKTALRPYESST